MKEQEVNQLLSFVTKVRFSLALLGEQLRIFEKNSDDHLKGSLEYLNKPKHKILIQGLIYFFNFQMSPN